MTQARSAEFWKENISKQSPDAERFSSQDWPAQSQAWGEHIDWMQAWEADEATCQKAFLSISIGKTM